jgi:hypothetical protein
MQYPISIVPGSIPRIILRGFSKQKYSGNLLYQFVDTEQKYQINPQLFLRTTGLLYSTRLNKQSATSAVGLAKFATAVAFSPEQRSVNEAAACFAADGIKLGYRGGEVEGGDEGIVTGYIARGIKSSFFRKYFGVLYAKPNRRVLRQNDLCEKG